MAARTFSDLATERGLVAAPAASAKAGPAAFRIPVQVVKAEPEKRLVWGWVSVVTKAGKPVVDHQGDVISVADLTEAAHDYVRHSRVAKRRHRGPAAAEMVESIVLSNDVQKALGIDLGREGWFAGFYIADDALWADAKAGKLPSFSIGGHGVRTPLED